MDSHSLIAACHDKACAPPPAGKGGSSKGDGSAISQSMQLLDRKSPGPGARLGGDDGSKKIPLRSIPNVSTERLRRHEREMSTTHTPEGLRAWDNTRRSLIEHALKLKVIRHELALRDSVPSGG